MNRVLIFILIIVFISIGLFRVVAQSTPVYNPTTGNYYDVILGSFDWNIALADAQTRSYQSCPGHLATITSAEENNFIVTNLNPPDYSWLGGFQSTSALDPASDWQWVTGEPFIYTNWTAGEPNDLENPSGSQVDPFPGFEDGDENVLHYYSPANEWNDAAYYCCGWNYVIEYDCPLVVPLPVFDSLPNPTNIITLAGTYGSTATASLIISNTGDTGSTLDVIEVGTLNNFSISTLPTALTPADGTFSVTVSCAIPQVSETLTLQTNETGNPTYTYTLQCVEAGTTLSINNVSVLEVAGQITFTLSLSAALGIDLTVDITSTDGSATVADNDYNAIPANTQVTIPAGTTRATYSIPINDDFIVESNETFTVNIFYASGASPLITNGTGIATIIDDDVPPPPTPTPPQTAQNQLPEQQSQIAVFDPAISKIGFLQPGQVGVTGEQVEWIVTVSNISNVVGQNIIVSDTLVDTLRIDSVNAPNGVISINGQTVTVSYALLNAGESVGFSIFTTVLQGVEVQNTACISAINLAASECATGNIIMRLPQTGENPFWRKILLLLIAPIAAISIKRRKSRI
jgi:uncharacterized repeat protein (TIGR01451 family)